MLIAVNCSAIDTVAQPVKPWTLTPHRRWAMHVPGCSTCNPAPCQFTWESNRGWSECLGPCTHERLGKAPRFWCQSGSIVAILEMNQGVNDLSLSFSLILCIAVSVCHSPLPLCGCDFKISKDNVFFFKEKGIQDSYSFFNTQFGFTSSWKPLWTSSNLGLLYSQRTLHADHCLTTFHY